MSVGNKAVAWENTSTSVIDWATTGNYTDPMKITAKTSNDAPLAMTIAKRAVWDTGMSPEDFLAVLRGRLAPAWPTRAFCVARLLECASWYDVVLVMEPTEICALWPEVERYVRSPSLRRGMEYARRILQ